MTLTLAPAAHAALSLTPAFTGSVSQPTYVTAPPGDSHRLFIVTRPGVIRVAVDGVLQSTPFLDITTRVSTSGEGGLLSMAFPSDYASSGKFYVYFAQKSDGDIRIEQFSRSAADPDVADTTPALMLDVPHPGQTNHYGGQLQWGADGRLYAGTGDGGGSNDPNSNAQDTGSMLGKLLAIDPANPGTATIAALGLRNPFRWSFDRTTHDLVIGDVGQGQREEIDYVPASTPLNGLNFGWPCREGTLDLSHSGCPVAGTIDPVWEYGHTGGSVAITGGVVVRDPALTPLFGRYLYADYYAGVIHSQQLATPTSTGDRVESLPQVASLVAFGEDADGRVYVVSLNGSVQRIVYTPEPAPPSPEPTPPAPEQPVTPTGQPPAATGAARDTTAPRLTIHAARIQDVLRRAHVRFAVFCDEGCSMRATATARGLRIRGTLRHLDAGQRETIELRVSGRVRGALARRGSVAIGVRARDAAGNLRTAALTIGVARH